MDMCLIQHYISKNFDFFDKSAVFLLAQMCCKDVEGMTRGSPLKRARYLPQHGQWPSATYKIQNKLNIEYKIQSSTEKKYNLGSSLKIQLAGFPQVVPA